jgi:hypothetical protein
MEFVNRGFNAAISIRQCATLKTWPEEMRRSAFVGQSLALGQRPDKLKQIVCGRSKKRPGGFYEWVCIYSIRTWDTV